MQNNQAIPFNKENFKQILSKQFAWVIVVSVPGALIAEYFNVPLAWFLGPMLVTSVVTLGGVKTKMPKLVLSTILIFLGLSSCIASKGLISSVKEIAELIERKEINNQNKKRIKEKVQRIVSRDVGSSSLKHLLRSSTESLTENSVDGIFGPLFWIFLGIVFMKFSNFLPGPLALGFSYKAVSTLDSMIGYKHDYFRYLGFFSAKIEDIFTFVPSRLVLITLPLVSSKVNEYGSIIKKSYLDGKKYDSPNAGISEAIFAYISGIKLGGKSKYKNEIIEKPIINETGDNCTEEKIKLICQLILRLQFLWIIIFALIFFIISSLI